MLGYGKKATMEDKNFRNYLGRQRGPGRDVPESVGARSKLGVKQTEPLLGIEVGGKGSQQKVDRAHYVNSGVKRIKEDSES